MEEARPSVPPPMRLDKFLAKHTSEDNAAFQEIMDGENKRRAKRHPWLHRDADNVSWPPPPGRANPSPEGELWRPGGSAAQLVCHYGMRLLLTYRWFSSLPTALRSIALA